MTEAAANPVSCEIPFDLASQPFAANDDDAFFFPSDQHLRAIEFMGHSLWTRARLGVVTADRGCGKSLLIKRLLRDLDDRMVTAAVSREQITPREFLVDVLSQFGLTLEGNDRTDLRRLLERFLHHQASQDRICLLVVENPQSMHPSVLEELRCLAATEVDGVRVLKILMLGQPSLNHVLESPRMSGLMAASGPRFSLGPLNEDQTAAYVAHRLRAAGARDPDALMPYTLMPQIYSRTGGVPAQINLLCSRALLLAAEEAAPMVTTTALDRAVMELGLPERSLPEAMRVLARHYRNLSDAPDAKLVVEMQGLPAREIDLSTNRVLIGRGDEADVRIDSVFVSRYHALIMRTGAEDLLLDLGSTNGLLVNSRRIVRRVLKHRDLMQVGPAKVTYLNVLAVQAADPDPAETICFARPGFPEAAGEEASGGTIIAFGRADSTGG